MCTPALKSDSYADNAGFTNCYIIRIEIILPLPLKWNDSIAHFADTVSVSNSIVSDDYYRRPIAKLLLAVDGDGLPFLS